MRKIYFIIFGVALVILILLVDWREKFDALTGKKSPAAAALGHFESAEPALADPTASEDSLLDFSLEEKLDQTGDLPPADLPNDLMLPGRVPAAHPMPARRLNSRPASSGLSSSGLPGHGARQTAEPPGHSEPRPAFQDVPEQPYLEESRQLLRQTVRNYDRIIAPPKPPQPHEDRPKP
jgi:hypothetical protein